MIPQNSPYHPDLAFPVLVMETLRAFFYQAVSESAAKAGERKNFAVMKARNAAGDTRYFIGLEMIAPPSKGTSTSAPAASSFIPLAEVFPDVRARDGLLSAYHTIAGAWATESGPVIGRTSGGSFKPGGMGGTEKQQSTAALVDMLIAALGGGAPPPVRTFERLSDLPPTSAQAQAADTSAACPDCGAPHGACEDDESDPGAPPPLSDPAAPGMPPFPNLADDDGAQAPPSQPA